ncbi:MAG: hypothetical protein PHE89_01175 [Alphaproteobacteria bacterium]|nr:hypothetical protein [Alphaproteobacteria bacterium]
MENVIFLFSMILSLLTISSFIFYCLMNNDEEARQRQVKKGFKAFSALTRIFIFLHGIIIALGFFCEFDFLKGKSVYFAVSLSLFVLIFLWGAYVNQKGVFKGKKYLFIVTEVRDVDDGREGYNLRGYIVQDSIKYSCQMRDAKKYQVGSKVEVDVWSIPLFGAFIVGEEWDF